MNNHPQPPPGWPQRVRRGLSFPPGLDGQPFETYLDREPGMAEAGGWERFEINLSTLQVFVLRGSAWDAPGWLELPPRVRARVWVLHEGG